MSITRTIAVAFVGVIVLSLPQHAAAHSAKSGWIYPPGCCSQPEKECREVSSKTIVGSRVNEFGQKYIIMHFEPGDHPNVKKAITFDRAVSWFKPSGDDQYHACIHPEGTAIYCFFIPQQG